MSASTTNAGISSTLGSISTSQYGNYSQDIFSRAIPNAHYFSYGNSTVDVKDGIWQMHIRERDYYSNGFAIGKLLSAAKYPALEFCRKFHITALFSVLYFLMKPQFSRIRIPERYIEELHGYADATGLSYRMLFCINFMFDVLKRFGLHCSSVVIMDRDEILVGRNTDVLPWIGRLVLKWFPSLVLHIQTPGKLRYFHVTPGFFLGAFNGFNEAGIAVLSHQVQATKEASISGNLATTLLQRMLLEEAGSISEADSITRANPVQRCINNMIVSDSERKSCVFEICPSAVRTISQDNSYQCCVTHFRNQGLATLHRKDASASEKRLLLMNALAERTAAMPGAVMRLLRNCENGLSFLNTGTSPTNEGTFQSLIFDFKRRRIFLADGSQLPVSLSGNYREISINV
jgi:hypothetical protein